MRESVCAHLQALSTAGRDGACDVPDRPAVGNALSPRSDIGRPPRSPSRCSRLCSTTPSLREIPQSIRRIHLLIRRRNSVRLNTRASFATHYVLCGHAHRTIGWLTKLRPSDHEVLSRVPNSGAQRRLTRRAGCSSSRAHGSSVRCIGQLGITSRPGMNSLV